jgi:hypothetical protein
MKAPHAIVPDIHAFNFPTGGQQVNDSGATSAAEAFFEIKNIHGMQKPIQPQQHQSWPVY